MTEHSRINRLPDENDQAPILRERTKIKSGSYCWASAEMNQAERKLAEGGHSR